MYMSKRFKSSITLGRLRICSKAIAIESENSRVHIGALQICRTSPEKRRVEMSPVKRTDKMKKI